MIKYFTVQNFRSIKNENILEFDVNLKEGTAACTAHPLIGIAGANASGKTSCLQALSFVFWFFKDSFLNQNPDEKIPLEVFCTQKHLPTHFHIIFSHQAWFNNNQKIDYEYKLCLNQEKVLSESLHYYHEDKWQCVYFREEQKIKFGEQISEISTNGLRKNSSIISYAAQDNTQHIAKLCKNYIVHSNVTKAGYLEEYFKLQPLETIIRDEYFQTRLQDFLHIADVGIQTIISKEIEEQELNQLLDALKNAKNGNSSSRQILDILQTKTTTLKKIVFTHNIDGHPIDFYNSEQESAGTLQFLVLLYRILSTLKNGNILILDEIELKLHSHLVAFMMGLFQNPVENTNCAQLIFSFHNTAFMELLTPEQLWFAEKNDDGQTELFSAADFQDIKALHQKSLENLYRLGRFGATPRGL